MAAGIKGLSVNVHSSDLVTSPADLVRSYGDTGHTYCLHMATVIRNASLQFSSTASYCFLHTCDFTFLDVILSGCMLQPVWNLAGGNESQSETKACI